MTDKPRIAGHRLLGDGRIEIAYHVQIRGKPYILFRVWEFVRNQDGDARGVRVFETWTSCEGMWVFGPAMGCGLELCFETTIRIEAEMPKPDAIGEIKEP